MTQAINQLKMNDAAIELTDNISEANALLALQSKLKKNSRIQTAANAHDLPIYVTKVINCNCFLSSNCSPSHQSFDHEVICLFLDKLVGSNYKGHTGINE